MVKNYLKNILVFFVVAPFVLNAAGLAIHPMEQFIKPQKSATYYASNQLDKAIAVEVILEYWQITEDGEELREETRELIAYPSQFILKGNTYKKIKIGLRESEQQFDLERCYRVTIRELPISLEPEEPGTFRIYQAAAYRTSFYIQPKNPRPELELVDATYTNKILTLRFHNDGNAHIHLRNPHLVLTAGDEQFEVTDKDTLHSINGENMHAQIMRTFHFDLSGLEFTDAITEVEIQFKDQGLLEKQTFQAEVTEEVSEEVSEEPKELVNTKDSIE